ncbi:esterase [Opitutus sp. ER46]|uniref:esterase n=1 Tax=Opitutus sp. ER46 TaxID=2161864 RepID=UPI001304FECE|nr:esterase [Opitutus sp. ER46]
MKPLVPVFLLSLVAAALVAAEPAPAPAPAPRRVIQKTSVGSPEIQDGAVTFRLVAASAQKVFVVGDVPGGRVPMTRGDEGVWAARVEGLKPGIWEYGFEVDGLRMIDPANSAIKPMRSPRSSILHLPANPPAWFDLQPVPHGVVHLHTYVSRALGRVRPLVVYTPPGYEAADAKRYPTLYLQHGSGDNEATWTTHGKAHWILDNLIAAGRARPMVIVMMDGHAVPRSGPENIAAFGRDLLEEVMPFVESTYRVVSDANHRALVGLSMGGGQSLTVGLTHLDRFAWVGAFSAGGPDRAAITPALADVAAANARLKLLWIACGRSDGVVGGRSEEFVAWLRAQGIHHEWTLTAGGHHWPVWRDYLADLAPRLFVGVE